jgi:hypothetical protein
MSIAFLGTYTVVTEVLKTVVVLVTCYVRSVNQPFDSSLVV